MNKYQKEKVKKMKKLSSLGVGYYNQKRILRHFNYDQIDTVIEQIEDMKRYETIFKPFQRIILKILKRFKL